MRRNDQSRSNSRRGRPSSGVSFALRNASSNRLSNNCCLFFSASTDCRKMSSLRSSCARMALGAASKSSKVRLRGAGVCERIALVSGSTRRIAPQSGQVTSNGLSALAFIAANILKHLPGSCRRLARLPLQPDGFVTGALLPGLFHQQLLKAFAVAGQEPRGSKNPLLWTAIGAKVERDQPSIATQRLLAAELIVCRQPAHAVHLVTHLGAADVRRPA